MTKRVVISGCSGRGKSSLIAVLANRGYQAVEEPGRRIVAEQRKSGGDALPWISLRAFAKQAIRTSLSDIGLHRDPSQWFFFDRGLVDAASALADLEDKPIETFLDTELHYNRKIFLTPPWPEIYVNDTDRRHQLSDAIREYDRLLEVYPSLGYEVLIIPRTGLLSRADYVPEQLRE